MKKLTTVVLALTLALALATPAFADGGPGSGGENGLFPDVTLSTHCNDEPKSVTLTNNSDFPILVFGIAIAGSLFDPSDPMEGMDDPIAEDVELAPGESETFAAPEGTEDEPNFVAVVGAIDAATEEDATEIKVVTIFAACDEFSFEDGMPGMPETGGGAGSEGFPAAGFAALVAALAAGAYRGLVRR